MFWITEIFSEKYFKADVVKKTELLDKDYKIMHELRTPILRADKTEYTRGAELGVAFMHV